MTKLPSNGEITRFDGTLHVRNKLCKDDFALVSQGRSFCQKIESANPGQLTRVFHTALWNQLWFVASCVNRPSWTPSPRQPAEAKPNLSQLSLAKPAKLNFVKTPASSYSMPRQVLGGGGVAYLRQLVCEARLAGELVLLQGEQQLLVVLHRVPTHTSNKLRN